MMKRLVTSESGQDDFSGNAAAAASNYGATPVNENASQSFFSSGGPKKTWRCWPIPRRYYLAAMAFLGFCNIYALRVNLSIAILKMTQNETRTFPNGTTYVHVADFYYWDTITEGVILGAFFYGYIFTQLPAGWLACRFGGKLLLGLGTAISGLLCLVTPPAAHWGKGAIITVRILQGFFQGVTFPSMHAIWGHWAPSQERTKLATIAVSGSYFGTVVAMPLSAYIGEQWGWPAIFYFFGTIALIWSAFWFSTVSETPGDDKHITKEELTYIQSSLGYTFENVKLLVEEKSGKDAKSSDDEVNSDGEHAENTVSLDVTIKQKFPRTLHPPWKEIFSSAAVWAIVASHFAENWGFYTMLTKLPSFMRDVLHYNMEKTGFLGALPYLAMGILVIVAGQLSDYLRTGRGWNTIIVRKMSNTLGLAVQSIFTLAVAYATDPGVAVAFITIAIGFGGFVWSAFSVNQLDIAPQYASVLMGISNTIATLPGMLSPPLTGAIVKHNHVSEWQIVFYIVAAIYVAGALIYAAFARAERQKWAQVEGGYVTNLEDLDSVPKAHEPD